MINVFCLLGFLEKVKPNEMPNSNSPLKYGKHTSIFYIPEVTENTLKQAEERADILLNKGTRTTISSLRTDGNGFNHQRNESIKCSR